jgi:hypothetical protein
VSSSEREPRNDLDSNEPLNHWFSESMNHRTDETDLAQWGEQIGDLDYIDDQSESNAAFIFGYGMFDNFECGSSSQSSNREITYDEIGPDTGCTRVEWAFPLTFEMEYSLVSMSGCESWGALSDVNLNFDLEGVKATEQCYIDGAMQISSQALINEYGLF